MQNIERTLKSLLKKCTSYTFEIHLVGFHIKYAMYVFNILGKCSKKQQDVFEFAVNDVESRNHLMSVTFVVLILLVTTQQIPNFPSAIWPVDHGPNLVVPKGTEAYVY